jgi:hypothetical protein
MAWYVVFVVLRLLVTLFFVVTSAYSVLNYTPFVFNQFLRVRMFGSINEFVASHHLWYCAAYFASVVTLIPDLKRPRVGDRIAVLARRLALAYVVVFGIVAEWLVVTPYLPTLWNDRRSFIAALLSFVPILWLALIDHVACRPGTAGEWLVRRNAGNGQDDAAAGASSISDQRRLLVACLTTAGYLWVAHLIRAFVRLGAGPGTAAWILNASWGLCVSLTAMLVLYAVLQGAAALAKASNAPRLVEYTLAMLLAAAVICLVLLGVVFPSIAFGTFEPPAVALTAGIALAAAWSGAALSRPRSRRFDAGGLDVLIAPVVPRTSWVSAAFVLFVPLVVAALLQRIERLDWNFLMQQTAIVLEWVLVFGLVFGMAHRLRPVAWSRLRASVPPVMMALVLATLGWASVRIPAWTGNLRFQPEVQLDAYAGADPSFKLFSDVLVRHPGRDPKFRGYLQSNTSVSTKVELSAPDAPYDLHVTRSAGRPPHIFLFVLDSLRRDYLSPFNPEVTFTPSMDEFARESFAFQNAFTRYGGTSLSVPSIWAGGLIVHRTWLPDFARSNALEKLVDADGYRWFMSIDSVMAPLLSRHADSVELDRGRHVMDFDVCRTLTELQSQIDRERDGRPAFAYSLPQNLHISITQHARVPDGEHYPGFFEPYAAEVHRIDGCFGRFVSFLKQERMYDDSIIVLTTDHGDSLGEEGRWGHGVTLFPEIVRIPLIIHLPERLKAMMTTDLARISFSTDIAPTLYGLLGHPVSDRGAIFGSPLFVSRELAPSTRGHDSFVVISSYGPTYGLLRHNGRNLYIVDVVNGREYAFDLTSGPLGIRVPVTDDIRRVNQPTIREQVRAIADLYRYQPPS